MSIFNQVCYLLTCFFHLTQEINVLILNGLDSVIMIFDGKLMLTDASQ